MDEHQCSQDGEKQRVDKGSKKDKINRSKMQDSRKTRFKMERIMPNHEHFFVFCELKKRCHLENRKIKKKNIQFTKINDD